MELVATGWCTRKWLSVDQTVRNFTFGDLGDSARSNQIEKENGENGEYDFSAVGIAAILGNGCAIQGQIYVALLEGSETTTEFHHRSCILCL